MTPPRPHVPRHRFAPILLALALCGLPASALIMVGKGNAPVPDAGWPMGCLEVANLKSRVAWYEGPPFGGGEWCFLYRGDAAALNEAMKALGAIRAPGGAEVVIRDGPENSPFLADANDPKADTRFDWSFTVWVPANWHRLYNDPRSTFTADQKNFRGPVAPPRLEVYFTPKIDWRQVKVPDGVRVVDERVAIGPAAAGQAPQGATVRGDVFDMASGKPIEGAEVRVERNAGKANAWEKVAAATSDATGRFALAGLPPGNYRLVASAAGYAPRVLGHEQFKPGSGRKLTVELSKAAALAGTVNDDAGRPVPDLTVRAYHTMGIDGRGYPQPETAEAKTDARGGFALANVPAGYLQASAQASGWFPLDSLKLYAVPDRQPVVLRSVATGGIRGKVVAKNGKPAGGTIHASPPGDPIGKWGGSMNLAADGTFEFKEVPPGTYTVSTRPQLPGVAKDPAAVDVAVMSGKVAEVTVQQ